MVTASHWSPEGYIQERFTKILQFSPLYNSQLHNVINVMSFINSSGYYFFVETSYPRKLGDKARLATFITFAGLSSSDFTCKMRFFYHMFGDHIGNLSVKVRDTIGGHETTLWKTDGNVGNYWIRTEVTLRSTKDFQVQ